MAKSKKTKIHKKIDGQILQMNKQFSNLKMKQKDKITEWVYEEYKKYVTEHDKVPDLLADEQIVEAVLDKINEAQIWIPDGEIYDYYRRKKPQLQKRLDNEKVIKFKSYVSFYKSIVDQDRASVVICNLKHEIIYMNPAAVTSCAKRGGDKLIGRSLLDCHNPESRDKIQRVVDWFAADKSHNFVYTFHNEKLNKDVYMVALRDEGTLDDGTGTDRTILSGIHAYYEPEELVGKTLIAITNLPPRKMMGIESCGMLLSAVNNLKDSEDEELHLLMVDNHIPAGAKLY